MYRFDNILVHQDAQSDSTAALKRAVELAKWKHGKLSVVDVVREMPAFLKDLVPSAESMTEAVISERKTRLHALTNWIREEGVEFSARVLRGRPFVELVHELLRGNYDLLIKDAHPEGSDLFFGSLDMRLLRYCPQPVWLVKPEATIRCERVLAAIDPEAGPSGMALNSAIIRLASLLAQHDEGQLHVVSAWRKPFHALEASDEYAQTYEKYADQIRNAARSNLDRVLNDAVPSVNPRRVAFRDGDAHEIIPTIVDDIDADLLVIGTVARTGVTGLLVGNTSEKVLRKVRCSVLTVKPSGFVSPLEADFDGDGD